MKGIFYYMLLKQNLKLWNFLFKTLHLPGTEQTSSLWNDLYVNEKLRIFHMYRAHPYNQIGFVCLGLMKEEE